MSEKIYFQWQNPILRETIYHSRNLKLRHFMLYYYEIDLWEQYKHQVDWPIHKFPKERAEFLAAQKKAITDAYESEMALKTYFRTDAPEVVDPHRNESNEDIRNLNKLLGNLRLDFRSFFQPDADAVGTAIVSGQKKAPKASKDIEKKSGNQLMREVETQKSRDRKERIFTAMRVSEWERHLKEAHRKLGCCTALKSSSTQLMMSSVFDNRSDSWMHAPRIRWGTLALGGNLVQVDGFEELDIKVKGFEDVAPGVRGRWARLKMYRLVGFRSRDWGRPLDELLRAGLVHRCLCAGSRNQINDSPQGIVYSPFFSVADKWDFRGNIQPNALYIPEVYLEEQGSITPEPKPRPKREDPKENKRTHKN